MDLIRKRHKILFSDPIYKVLCSSDAFIQLFQNLKLPELVDYPTEEKRTKRLVLGHHRFNLSDRGGFSDIRLSIDDWSKIDKIYFCYDDFCLLKLDGPILSLIYGEHSIITLSEALSCSQNQPIISEIPNLGLEIYNKEDVQVELTLTRTDDYHEYKVKKEKYPLYNCKNQDEVNCLFAEKLNELTTMINSGKLERTELIKIKGENQTKKVYYEDSKRNLFPCIEYRSFKFSANGYENLLIDISRNTDYLIGFYIYLENFSDVFNFVDSICVRIYNLEFKFTESDCCKYGKCIFISLVNGFTNDRKPWLIEDWIAIFKNNAIPNFKQTILEIKIVFKNISKCEGFIIPIIINARIYDNQSVVKLFY